jgi:nitrogenase iron protein NifH
MNRRNVEGEEEKVRAFAAKAGLPVVADIPRSNDIIRFEDLGKTVVEGDPELPVSRRFLDLARLLTEEEPHG